MGRSCALWPSADREPCPQHCSVLKILSSDHETWLLHVLYEPTIPSHPSPQAAGLVDVPNIYPFLLTLLCPLQHLSLLNLDPSTQGWILLKMPPVEKVQELLNFRDHMAFLPQLPVTVSFCPHPVASTQIEHQPICLTSHPDGAGFLVGMH